MYQLKIRHCTLRGIAREAGITYHTLRGAFFQPSFPSEKLLADAIGLTVEQLFAERYDDDGNRIPNVRGQKANAAAPSRQRRIPYAR